MKKTMAITMLVIVVGGIFAFDTFKVHSLGVDAVVYAQEKNAGSLGFFAQKWLFWWGSGISSGEQFLGLYGEFGFILPFVNGMIIIPTGRVIFGGQQDEFKEIEYDFRSAMGISFEIGTRWGSIIPGIQIRGLQDAGLVIGARFSVPFR